MTSLNTFHKDLKTAKTLLYDPCGFSFTNPILNAESREYGACSFQLNGKSVQHRVSKITPTKTGQFVAIWKRNTSGKTTPFDGTDEIDFMIITSRSGANLGQFIIPKSVLLEKGIISRDHKGGKRGMRVYPPWDLVTSKQAEKTQRWQTNYFLNIKNDGSTNLELIKRLFECPI